MFTLELPYALISVVSAVLAACVAGKLASEKNKNVVGCVVLSLIFSWLVALVLWLMPAPGRKHSNQDFLKSSSQPQFKCVCSQCGNTLTGGQVCDMCGFNNGKNPGVQSTNTASPIVPETKKVPKYTCAECGETIDTLQCPWCGAQKRK